MVAVIYPREGMRVEATVPEDSRSDIKVGDKVMIELEADESKTYKGVVTMVSSVAESGSAETSYRVLVGFTPDHEVNFGMSVVVTTLEAEDEEEVTEHADEPAEEKDAEEISRN